MLKAQRSLADPLFRRMQSAQMHATIAMKSRIKYSAFPVIPSKKIVIEKQPRSYSSNDQVSVTVRHEFCNSSQGCLFALEGGPKSLSDISRIGVRDEAC
jgi:hypothetical protein